MEESSLSAQKKKPAACCSKTQNHQNRGAAAQVSFPNPAKAGHGGQQTDRYHHQIRRSAVPDSRGAQPTTRPKALGVDLERIERKDSVNDFIVTKLPKPISDFRQVVVSFGENNSLWRINGYGRLIDDDASASRYCFIPQIL